MKRKHSEDEEEPPSRRFNVVGKDIAQVQVDSINQEKMAAMDIDPNESNIDQKNKESPTTNCKVYWGKNVYDVIADLNEPLIILKTQIFDITQVNPERQKIVYNGRILTDECWPDSTIKNGSKMRMIGTNDIITVPIIAEDDKTASAKAQTLKLPPFGIKNYGNTCFMNSVLQLIRSLPELKEAVIKHNRNPEGNQNQILEGVVVKSMAELFKALDQRSDTYERFMGEFIKNIESIYPEYSSSIEKGGRLQQDANEFFMRILDILKKNLNYQVSQYVKGRDVIETMFGIDIEKTYKCLEKDGDSTKTSSQTELELSCFINSDTKYMIDGIKSKLKETITKKSVLLDKDAIFSINTTITRLPAYLCVQFVRFYYKEQEKVNAKILRDVKFPLRLDLTELCSPTLKDKLKTMQAHVREFENKFSMTESEQAKKMLLKRQENGAISLPEQKLALGDSGSGIYQLMAVLTHQGRSTSSGHYVGWIRTEERKWVRMDDDSTSFVEEDDILKLSGGGEYHTAYLLIYQTFKLPKSGA